MKKRIKTDALSNKILISFDETKLFIVNKYFNLFMNKIDVGGVDYQQKDYILRKFWSVGTIATFIMAGTKGAEDAPNGLPVFCPYAPAMYNLYDFPIKVTLVNTRGVDFIPSTLQEVDKDVCIGWCMRNKKGVKYIVDYYAKRIALIECVIQTQLLAQKMPFLFGVTPENKEKMEDLWNSILDDNPALFVDVQDINALKVLITATGYNIDSLKALKDDQENELRECLGLNNLGVHEKKEHLINAEIESNDETTEESGNTLIDCLNEFALQVKKTFDYPLTFTWKESKKIEKEESKNDFEEEDEE